MSDHPTNPDDFDGWWWLSFCDTDKPPGSQFLGVAIVRGDGMLEAVQRAWLTGCNPGGQVQGTPLTEASVVPEEFSDRLMRTKDEARSVEKKLAALNGVPYPKEHA